MKRGVKIKICGIGDHDSLMQVIQLGVDAVGFVFYDGSPRGVTGAQVKGWIPDIPPFVSTVGIFVDDKPVHVNSIIKECNLTTVQLHGHETPEYCSEIEHARIVKAFRINKNFKVEMVEPYIPHLCGLVLDSTESGSQFDWNIAVSIKKSYPNVPLIIAGGLTADNVQDAIRKIRPYAIDVASSIESEPGIKDPEKVKSFIDAVDNCNIAVT